jgi:hypothetical protein
MASASNGNRSAGARPPRAANSAATCGTSAAAAPASTVDQRTPPVLECTAGASLTASTAANPTPNRPTDCPSRLADARRVHSADTPSASSGAPVFAALSTAASPS